MRSNKSNKINICNQCNQPFNPYYHKPDQKYCSRKCFAESSRRQVEKSCERCGKTFSVYQAIANQRFCSWKCRSFGVEKECKFCGLSFRVKPSDAEIRWTCSRKCAALLRAREGRSPAQNHARTKEEKDKIGDGLRRYYNGDPTKHWNYLGGPGQERGPSWPKQRDLARKRDGNQCIACLIHESNYGKKIPVHHIVPYRLFHAHEIANRLDNLVSLCQSCHMKMERGRLFLIVKP